MSKASTKAKNKYKAKAYDKIESVLPKGTKEELQTITKEKGIRMKELIKKAINHYIKQVQDFAPEK